MSSSQSTTVDPLLRAIRELQSNNPKPDTAVALSTLHKRLQKIAKHPFESKYRVIEDDDQAYVQKIGRLKGAKDLLIHAGFVRETPNTWELKANAEAWPRLIQSTALLSQAVREAEQVTPSSPSVATGKSNSSKSSLKTATTASTSSASSPVDETLSRPTEPRQPQHQAAQGPSQAPPRPNNSKHTTAPPSPSSTKRSAQQAPPFPGGGPLRNGGTSIHSAKTFKSHDTSRSQDTTAAQKSSKKTHLMDRPESVPSATARLKAAALKVLSEKATTEESSLHAKETRKTNAQDEKLDMHKSVAAVSATAKLKTTAQKADQGINDEEQPSQPKHQSSPPKSAVASGGMAKLKAAALKASKEKATNEQQQLKSTQKELSETPTSKSASPTSMMEKFKAGAINARKEKPDEEQKQKQLKSAQKDPQQSSPPKSASPTSIMEKFKAAALRAGKERTNKEQRQRQPEQTTPYSSPRQKSAAANGLAKFKAAASAVGKQSQTQARQNPLKLAAQMAADDDDRSVRSERSTVSLRDLALHNSAANLQNSSSNLKLSGTAISKFKAAAQQVQAQEQQQTAMNNSAFNLSPSPGGANKFKMAAQIALMQQRQHSPVKDPRSRFQNTAQMAMMQQQLQRVPPPNADPRSRFQNAAQMMMLQQQQQQQQQQQKAALVDPRARFQNIAQMAMAQQRQQQSPKMDPRSKFQNAAQMAMLQNSAKRSSRMKAGWDGLSYPTSADSDDGLSYPTAAPGDEAARPVRRSKSFDDGRPFMLRTDSGRSLMSSSSNNLGNAPPVPNNLSLAPNGSSRRQLHPSASFRSQASSRNVLNASGSVRNLSHQPSMRAGVMIQGAGPSRPQLMRENSLSLRDLQRAPGMMGAQPSQRQIMGGSVKAGMVSATPKDMQSPEQPQIEENKKTSCSSCGFIYTAVNLVTLGELTLDLVTTILSFIQLSEEFSCCGNKVDYGVLTLCVTIPYFFLVLVEFTMLLYGIFFSGGKQKEKKHKSGELEDSGGFDDESTVTVSWQCTMSEALSWVLCINPFLGTLITWTLMYEVESKNEALVILGLEGGAIFLMFVTIYLERNELSTCTMMVHLTPLVPFTVTCFVVWYYLERGGICFIVKENNFWFDGCELCADGWPPDENGICPDGDIPMQGTYCGDKLDEQFCYYGY